MYKLVQLFEWFFHSIGSSLFTQPNEEWIIFYFSRKDRNQLKKMTIITKNGQ